MDDQFTYKDFDLLIEPGSHGRYRARVLQSPAGESPSVQFTVPFSPLELENFVLKFGQPRRGTRGPGRPESAPLKDFGGKLYGAVFTGEVRDRLLSSLSQTRAQGMGMRLRLRLNDVPELAELPWEFLFDPRLNRFLAQSRRTPLVRYLDLPDPPGPLSVEGPLRLLVMISSPSDYPPLNVEREWSLVTDALAGQQAEGRVIVERLAANMSTLRDRLRRERFHVFHFVGHGRYRPDWGDGVLVMEDRNGRSHEVTGEELGGLISEYDPTRLAVLNACEGARSGASDPFAGMAQSLIQQGLPAVVAMQFEITDDAAIIFARELYAAIADGYPLEAALAEARGAIRDAGIPTEWGTPVLYSRAPDGRLFDLTRQAQKPDADHREMDRASSTAQVEADPQELAEQAQVVGEAGVGDQLAARDADHYDMGLRQTTNEGNLVPVAPSPDADHYDMVLQQIIDEDSLVLFLGARSGELAAKLAERFGQKTRQDLPDIAQAIYVTRGRPDLYRALRPILGADREPGLVHRFMARLPRTLEELGLEKRYQLIVSMTFDMALERAFDDEQEPYDLVIYMASGPDKGKFVHFPWEGSPRPIVSPNSYDYLPIRADYNELARTVIVKPYGAADGSLGDYRWKESYILTRDQYLNYLTRSPIEGIFPVQILAKLRDSHCLFLDCPARDWWQHILLDRVWEGRLGARSWAVEPDADQFEMNSWARANVDLYAADPAQYVDQLRERLSLLNRTYRPPAQSSSVVKRQLKIFINYRHADTQGTAWALYMKLAERFDAENVFFDHGSLRPGMQWFDEIKSHMTVDSACLVLIGPQWTSILTSLNRTGAEDYVAKEIDLALRSGPGITVIPVLVDSADMPDNSELPPSLRALLRCQAERLRPNSLVDDIQHLSDRLSEIHET